MEHERIQALNGEGGGRGRYVLYWMQASQRVGFNPALEHAVARANDFQLPLVVGFGLTDSYPDANQRHYAFLLEGLADVRQLLRERGILFVVRRGDPGAVAVELSRDAALLVCDRGYLRHQKAWRERVAREAPVRVEQVEGDVVVPVAVASDKLEYAARTIRPKIQRALPRFLVPLEPVELDRESLRMRIASDIDVKKPRDALAQLRLDSSVPPVKRLRGGEREGRRMLEAFVATRLAGYGASRNEPADFRVSYASPYLHFGQLSPVEIALAATRAPRAANADREAFIEQLVVRRELAINFVHHQPRYDEYTALPEWARQTLAEHASDERPYTYSRARLVAATTHDPHWNALMREMVHTGYMHNTLRMYWAKKILEWSKSPLEAFRTTLALNNKYFLDGRDPNSYVGVAWCFGLHDRAWTERAIFGKVRYMNDRGLERKYDMAAYAAAVDDLVSREQ